MASKWEDIPLSPKLLSNVKEAVLSKSAAAYENVYLNDAGGQSRFPGLKPFITLLGSQPTYLHEWRHDLMAVSSGRLWRVDRNGNKEDVTDVEISGNRRVIFDRTPNELSMAAGGDVIRFAGQKTEILDQTGTLQHSTHVGYIDAFLVAIERYSGLFFNSNANAFRQWDPINVFSANSKPDDLNSFLITPFRELIFGGEDSVEQWERLSSGTAPFFRRWAVGEGVRAPYTMCFADNATWFINKAREFVRLSGQTVTSLGDDIGMIFEGVDDDAWQDAWTVPMKIAGQKFILLQIPTAINAYGTVGITALFDYRQKRWYALYGWDPARSVQVRWPGWSYYMLWGRHFVGGNGQILELDQNTFSNNDLVQKAHFASAHMDTWGEVAVNDIRMRVKRGGGSSYTQEPQIGVRVTADNERVTQYVYKGLGLAGEKNMEVRFGQFGSGHTLQFEVDMTDAAEYEVVKMQAYVEPVGFR